MELLEELPGRIEAMEQEQNKIYEKMADESFYRDGGSEVVMARDRLSELERLLETAYGRWEELETIRETFGKR